jgi:acetylglutamate kinase
MRELIEKADVLIEALPYIQRFRRKVVVVKYGGSTMETGEQDSMLRDIVFMECVGMRPVIVHGGGDAISRRLKERGITPCFMGGLRVTDAETMRIVEEVLLGVNAEIVRKLEEFGGRVRGLSGRDGIIHAVKHLAEVERDGRTEKVDIGFVGDVVKVEKGLLGELCRRDIIPVIAPLGLGDDGQLYNINADTAAAEVAAALKASKLILLTDVRGIMRDPEDQGSLIGTLRVSDVDTLIAAGVITEGMLPKVRAAVRSVQAGVKKTHIIDGRIPHSMLLEIFTDTGIGTEILNV